MAFSFHILRHVHYLLVDVSQQMATANSNHINSTSAITTSDPTSSIFASLYSISSNLLVHTDSKDDGNRTINTLVIGCVVGVVSAATQALGLTLQRKSHLDNDAKPVHLRKPAHRRILWQLGVCLFLLANVVGSSVQITTLPLIVLSPLQAVGLVFNSLCASWVLHEPLTKQSILGTLLVALGALIVASWGVISESSKPHNLSELLRLLKRPQFLTWMAFTMALVIAVLVHIHRKAHTEMHKLFDQNLLKKKQQYLNSTSQQDSQQEADDDERRYTTYYSNPNSPLNSESSDSTYTTKLPKVQANPLEEDYIINSTDSLQHSTSCNSHLINEIGSSTANNASSATDGSSLLADTHNKSNYNSISNDLEGNEFDDDLDEISSQSPELYPPKQRLINGLLYSVVCGILSAHSLLMAKSAVEILVRAFVDGKTKDLRNYQSWLIVLAFLGFAVSQLVFMNRGLRLCSTAVLYPLVFCVFNVASILNSLIYFQQTADMTIVQALMVGLGTALILLGVLGLSWHLGWHDSLGLDDFKTPRLIKSVKSLQGSTAGEEHNFNGSCSSSFTETEDNHDLINKINKDINTKKSIYRTQYETLDSASTTGLYPSSAEYGSSSEQPNSSDFGTIATSPFSSASLKHAALNGTTHKNDIRNFFSAPKDDDKASLLPKGR